LPFLGLAFGLGAPLRPAERRGAGIEAVLASKLMLYGQPKTRKKPIEGQDVLTS
jgi:hypothetical protein